MDNRPLEERFDEAVDIANTMTQASLPQDVQLRLYALYKQSTLGRATHRFVYPQDLRNAFKMNAWIQINHLSQDEAKEQYIQAIMELAQKKSK
ncbi:acyl-CoA-binding protein [Flavobacterium sp.]|jgi:acyl-CoA-binding protein|uniref:acyl-CoA-binding protein n=2 Tax=Flavobacterium sp. TaxID=239 RepID=UPI0022C63EA5|nr:acyl-CoA-binding protein [Flavobacterium sp.]MCZ8143981.1 acyl-CoA-binding protein [Flavobacterium sp.]MCZ8366466.1 acyl-CoA-binding protein [Flavobacterium sp.]